jgi:hypothetical protein
LAGMLGTPGAAAKAPQSVARSVLQPVAWKASQLAEQMAHPTADLTVGKLAAERARWSAERTADCSAVRLECQKAVEMGQQWAGRWGSHLAE